jgi:hypothetical protein
MRPEAGTGRGGSDVPPVLHAGVTRLCAELGIDDSDETS